MKETTYFIGVMCFVSVIAARNLNDCLPCLPLKTEKQKRKSIFFYRDNFMLPLKGVWTSHFHFIDSREEIRRAGMPGDNVCFDTCVLTTPRQSLARKHRSFKLAPRLSPKKVLIVFQECTHTVHEVACVRKFVTRTLPIMWSEMRSLLREREYLRG